MLSGNGTRRFGKALIAFFLGIAMLVGLGTGFAPSAAAAPSAPTSSLVLPTQVQEAEKPDVWIETNIVLNTQKKPTQYVELVLKARTPTIYFADAAMTKLRYPNDGLEDDPTSGWTVPFDAENPKTYAVSRQTTFREIGASFQYNTNLLVPVSWEHEIEWDETGKIVQNAYPDFYAKYYVDESSLMKPGADGNLGTNDDVPMEGEERSAEIRRQFADDKNLQRIAVPTLQYSTESVSSAVSYAGGSSGLISMAVNSNADTVLPQESALAVVRFLYIGEEPIEHLLDKSSDPKIGYTVNSNKVSSWHNTQNGGSTKPDGTELNDFFWFADDSLIKNSTVQQALIYTSGRYQENLSVESDRIGGINQFYATKAIYNGDEVPADQLPDYTMATISYDKHPTDTNKQNYTVETPEGMTSPIHRPKTDEDNITVLATARKDGDKLYSYTSNLLFTTDRGAELVDGSNENIAFTLRAGPTYKSTGGGTVDDFAAVVFIDWDDTMLGALVVPKGDARDRVEEYVEKFIHPTLRKSTAMAMDDGPEKQALLFNLSRSLDRKYTYAGSHTSDYATLSAFAGMSYSEAEAAMSTDAAYLGKTIFPDGYTVDDVDMAGSSYPLTNKLDYAFLRRPVLGSETITADTEGSPYVDADGKTVDAVEWNLGAVDYDALQTPETVDDNYWYTSGWAIVKQPSKVSDVWTTFSTTGELSEAKLPAFDSTTVTAGGHEYDGMSYFNADYIRATGDPATATMAGCTAVGGEKSAAGGDMAFATYADSEYFEFANFADVQVDELFVKACYEPCEQLSWTDYYIVISAEPYYVRYGTVASTVVGSVYSVSFEYERVNTAGVGVQRIRSPWTNVQYTMDVGSTAEPDEGNNIVYSGDTFYVGVEKISTDIIAANFTPTSSFISMKYGVVEAFNCSNFVASIARSKFENEAGVIDNFKYLTNTDLPESWENGYRYDNRLGTDGYVYRATLRQIEEEATKIFSGASDLSELDFRNSYLTTGTMMDLNVRLDKEGTTGDGAGLGLSDRNRKILNAQRAIYDALRIAYKYNSVDKDGVIDIDWHQLQYHILNWDSTNGGGGIDTGSRIRTKEECGQYQWCRLDACGESISIPVTNFAELYDAIGIMNDSSATQARRDAAKKAIDENALGIINAPNLKIFKTNKSSDGSVEYKTLDDLKANGMYVQSDIDTAGQTGLIGALKALRDSLTDPSALSEKQLQKWLMTYAQNPATASYNFDEDGQDRYDYWWFYWDTKPEAVDFDSITPDTTLELLVKTAYAYHNDNPLAWDGFKAEHMEKTRLRASERGDFYDATAQGAFAGGAIEFEWRADADRVLTPLTDVDAFIATMTELIANAATDNGANEEWASENDTINKIAAANSWEQLQYYLLHGETTAHPEYYAGTENGQYWWKDESAGTRLTKTATSIDTLIVPPISRPTNATMADLRTKLEAYAGEIGAAKEAAAEKFRIWFTQETAVDLVLKRTERGGNITTANTEAIATALLEFATQHKNSGRAFSDISWSQVQHYILNGTYTSTKGAQSFTHGTRCTWGENAWREPKIESITELARLIEIIDSAKTAADIESWVESFEDLTIPNLYFKVDSDKLVFGGTSAGAALMQLKTDYATTGGVWAELALTDNIDSAWYLIQYYLYHGNLVTGGNVLEDTATAGKLEYWWKDGWEGISTWRNFYDLVRGDVPARVDWLGAQGGWDNVTYMRDLRATSWAEVISTVKQLDVANLSQDNLWYNLQFAAIHKQIAPTSQLAVDEGTNFYWWYNKGSATSVRLPALPDEANEYANDISQLNSAANAIAENKLREIATGNTVAGALVTATNVAAMHVRVPDDSSATRAEMSAYDDATVATSLENLIKHVYETSVADGVSGWDYVTDDGVFTYNEAAMTAVRAITVYDIQHWLVEGKYPAPGDASTTYWWIENDVKPGGRTPLDDLKDVYIAIFAYGSKGKVKQVPTDIIDQTTWKNKFGYTKTLTNIYSKMNAAKANEFIALGTYNWAQLEEFFVNSRVAGKVLAVDKTTKVPPSGLEGTFTISQGEIDAFIAANGLR